MTAVRLLSDRQAEELRARPFTYPEVGRTRGALPVGYHHVRQTRRLSDSADFESVAETLGGWRVQATAGLTVAASSVRVETGSVVLMRLGIARLGVAIPCRVVYTIDEPQRRGFAYGTLPGHPESGEESFVLTRQPDGSVTFTITAFSRPVTALSRLGGPLTGAVQRFMTSRYLTAIER